MPSSWRQAGSLGRLRRKPVHREHDQPLPHRRLRDIISDATSATFCPIAKTFAFSREFSPTPALDNCANCSSQGSPQPSTSALWHLVFVRTSHPWKLSTCRLLHQLSVRLPLFIVNLDNHQSVLNSANVRSPSAASDPAPISALLNATLHRPPHHNTSAAHKSTLQEHCSSQQDHFDCRLWMLNCF